MRNEEKIKSPRQKYLGEYGLVGLLGLLGAFVPLSMDMYLPALPNMARYFSCSDGMINMTLVLFFLFYSFGALFWGPMSDKYGRRNVLLAGLAIYTMASFFCAMAENVNFLIAGRVLQAIGGGAAMAVSTALVKDLYEGHRREKILAVIQSMNMIAPVAAPVIGSGILLVMSWQGIFWTLGAIGLLAATGSFFLEETLKERYHGSIAETIGRLGVVLKNPGFTILLLVFSCNMIPLMAFIASSSYIFVDGFGLSEQVFSYYFAGNAVFAMLAPFLYIRLSGMVSGRMFITISYAVSIASGLMMCWLGGLQPWLLIMCIIPNTLAGSTARPPSTNLMLEQQQKDIGSAASLMGCVGTLMGSAGMLYMSVGWSNKVMALGILYAAVGVLGGIIWILVAKKPYIRQVSYRKTDLP